MSLKLIMIPLMALSLLISCNKKDDDDGMSCSFYEEHFGGIYSATFVPGEKAAQRFKLTRSTALTKITLEMDLLNSQSITMSVHQGGNGSPTGSTRVAQSTILSSSVSNTGKVSFNFNGTRLSSGTDYYLILESTGGNFEMTMQYRSFFDIYGEVWEYSSSTWNDDPDYDFSFSMNGGC